MIAVIILCIFFFFPNNMKTWLFQIMWRAAQFFTWNETWNIAKGEVKVLTLDFLNFTAG